MSARAYPLIQALLMAGLGLFLAEKLWSGAVFYYINERFLLLIAFGAAAALALAAGAAWRWWRPAAAHAPDHDHDHDHDHAPARFPIWTVALVALPLALGLAVPARPLGASALASKGLNASGGALLSVSGGAAVQLEIAPEQRTVLDWVRAFNYAEDPAIYTDQPADVIGFVYRTADLRPDQFMVSRFIVTCCAADASGVAMLVDWPQAAALAENTWVRVRGPVRAAALNGQPLPLIAAVTVEPAEQPEHPYMYP
ncbi:MAG: TIGR03943 family protein [Anaerolineales bacterium]|nr:TIGR03943 family protein [Anaerolineales bacterium]